MNCIKNIKTLFLIGNQVGYQSCCRCSIHLPCPQHGDTYGPSSRSPIASWRLKPTNKPKNAKILRILKYFTPYKGYSTNRELNIRSDALRPDRAHLFAWCSSRCTLDAVCTQAFLSFLLMSLRMNACIWGIITGNLIFSPQGALRCLESSGRRSPSTPAPCRLTPRRCWPCPRCRMRTTSSWSWTSSPWPPSRQKALVTTRGLITAAAATTTNVSVWFRSCLTTLLSTMAENVDNIDSRWSTPVRCQATAGPRRGIEHHRLDRFDIAQLAQIHLTMRCKDLQDYAKSMDRA